LQELVERDTYYAMISDVCALLVNYA